MKRYLPIIILILIIGVTALVTYLYPKEPNKNQPANLPKNSNREGPAPEVKKVISLPIEGAGARITKKSFGIYITPQTSPVQPEKFTGYHTGTDFEITPAETSKEIPIYAICDGAIRQKQVVSGYGGVIIQDCSMEGQVVTVLYGHINITASSVQISQQVVGGTLIATLADDKSYYSGGERKHLHLGIHKGAQVDYRGYVSSGADLSAWLDIKSYL